MYAAHFGFRDQPFSITPDPTYLYMSPHHQEALAHLLYGTGELGGFVQLTGEVGTGKTTLVRTLAEQHIEQLDVALCLNPRLTVVEFMAALCDELKIHYPPQVTTLKPLVDALNQHLLTTHAEGRRTVLIIDEAQNLSPEVLEQVRLLTNLETHRHKLLRIILVGQPELQQLLSRRDMRQLAQRITARYHLLPLSADQTRAYVQHRLRIAGAREGVFTAAALRSVHRITRGIPRLINVICDRALLASYVQGLDQVNATVLRRAAREALHGSHRSANHKLTAGATIAAALLLAIALGWFALNTRRVEPQPPPPTASQTSEAEHSVQSSPIVAMVEALADPSPETIATLPPPATTISTVAPPPTPSTETTPGAEPSNTASNRQREEASINYLLDHLSSAPEALGKLLAIWQDQPWDGTLQDCGGLQRYGLGCLEGTGNLDTLQRFNRPVLISLSHEQGAGFALLRMVDDNMAIFAMDDNWLSIPISRFTSLWGGEFILLWRRQSGVDFIGPGVSGPPINWLRQRLALIDGGPASGDASGFDAQLQERVRGFQRSQNLEADGLVGARTMTLLNNLQPEAGTPLLTREPG